MFYIIILTLHISGLLIYWLKKKWVLYFYIIWNMFMKYIASFVIFDKDLLNVIGGQSNYYILLIFLLTVCKYSCLKINNKAFYLCGCILFLLVLEAIIHDIPIASYLRWCVSNILPLYFIVFILKKSILCIKGFRTFCLTLLVIQLIMGYCQYYTSILFVSPFYALNEYGIGELNQFMGSFSGSNTLDSYICMLYFIVVLTTRMNSTFIRVLIGGLTIAVVYAILLSGIRTYLLLLLVYFGVLLYVKFNNKIVAFGAILSVFFVASTYLIVASYGNIDKAENPIERQINGLSALKAGDTDDSTLSYSTYVIDNYYNPLHIFGEGKLYTKRGYGKIFLRDFGIPDADVTDATLAVYFVEFGIILFALFIYYFYYLTYRIHIPYGSCCKKEYLMIFSFFFVATVTDAGIFNVDILTLLSIYVACLKESSISGLPIHN